ncbi:MAG: heme iron utilization protein [Sulfurimonas sp.]|nr:heme iron utilization protein [Sulfurimonas sp.]MBU3938466.1 pyridoxamine 5'-phosphate oxidase family protein [bacterium]MBU4025453.1 pyridoxamine 5'-phosphate oxidase family protein [bacterium]MBU4059211.1 pyridoxamine 5'-phosphate oxidase family protein [bacterium]MBU4111406.1 pyridoxamine 5'-phosphate oxidase family protein [bacterium]
MKTFLENIQTAVIGSLNEAGHPFSSYAPYVYENNRFYIYISDIATHSKNLKRSSSSSLFFIEDESKTENLFARKRISLECEAAFIPRDSLHFEEVLNLFEEKFDASMVQMLKKMVDFNLVEFEVKAGEATFGFGEAYVIGGENMNELRPRTGGSGHKK